MRIKNTVLLGFVNKAVAYLKEEYQKNGQEDDLSLLKLIDIDSLKEALLNEVISSTDKMAAASSLLEAGGDVFNQLKNQENDNALIDEFAKMFEDITPVEKIEDTKVLPSKPKIFEEPDFDEEFIKDDDEYLRMIAQATGNVQNVNVDTQIKHDDKTIEELDSLLSEIVSQEEAPEEKEEETIPNGPTYVSSLIKEMKQQIKDEKEARKKEDNVTIFEKIAKLYPYLSGGFIRSVFDLKESLLKEYPLDRSVIILHRLSFKDVDQLRQFVEIVSNHNYTVNVDEKKMIVDVFKEHINTDGKILTNIFEISNQAKVLDGDYEGYRVVLREE